MIDEAYPRITIGFVDVPALVKASVAVPRAYVPDFTFTLSPATAFVSMVAHEHGVPEFTQLAHVSVPVVVT